MIKTISTATLYSDAWVTIVHDQIQLPNNQESTYTYIKRANGVFVLITNQSEEILLINQYRYPINKSSWEIPGGGINPNETPQQAAVREIAEETGIKLQINKLKPFLILHLATGLVTNIENIFHIQVDSVEITQSGEADEIIHDIKFIPLQTCLQMIESQQITDASTIASIVKFAHSQLLAKV